MSTGTGSVPRSFTKFIPARCERSYPSHGADSQDPWRQEHPHTRCCFPALSEISTRDFERARSDRSPLTTHGLSRNSTVNLFLLWLLCRHRPFARRASRHASNLMARSTPRKCERETFVLGLP